MLYYKLRTMFLFFWTAKVGVLFRKANSFLNNFYFYSVSIELQGYWFLKNTFSVFLLAQDMFNKQ